MTKNHTYKDFGVDIHKGNKFVSRLQEDILDSSKNFPSNSFASFYDLSEVGYREPVLLSATDGVGTKTIIAEELNSYADIGIDLVAMCVNDILVYGGKPLYFLDYIGTSNLREGTMLEVVSSIKRGCSIAGCQLLGGETAEMPGIYNKQQFDLAGFVVGIVEKTKILDGTDISSGDKIIGISSYGCHSNGYTLIRGIVDGSKNSWKDESIIVKGESLGQTFLRPTKIYVEEVHRLLAEFGIEIKSMAHVTGGGIANNLSRSIVTGKRAMLSRDSFARVVDSEVADIYAWLQEKGNISLDEMYSVFNMGIGYILVVSSSQADKLVDFYNQTNTSTKAGIIGEIVDNKENQDNVVSYID